VLELANQTPFRAALTPALDLDGRERAVIAVKGTFALRPGAEPTIDDEQQPILHADVHHGEPAASSVLYAADVGPPKPGTDVVLIGRAHAPREVPELDVELRVGPVGKVVRVIGARHWYRAAVGWQPSEPRLFARMPLVYERAFGGADGAEHEERNPVGVGFVAHGSGRELDGQPLPSLEDPRALITEPGDRPPPACFGFVGRHWMPRLGLAGTFDARWRAERAPLLPLDFDARHLHAAHTELATPAPLRGGEPVRLRNASPDGDLAFALPSRSITVQARLRGQPVESAAELDTVLLEPDLRRLVLTWRASIACSRSFLYLDHVVVREGP
jgi:hypothetical protein